MITLEELLKMHREVLSEFLSRNCGPFRHEKEYYDRALIFLADFFQSGHLSTDDLAIIAEEIFVSANLANKSAMREIPGIFTSIMELEWDIRNNPERAVHTLQELKMLLPE